MIDIEKAKKKFSELFGKLIDKSKVNPEQESILMIFYLKGYQDGFDDGSGMTQVIA